MYCVLADRLNTAKYLIRQGALVACVDNHGRSAVHIAAHKGAIKFLHLLAEKGADFSLPDKEGQTPLHLATNRRNQDGACVRYILKKTEANYIDARIWNRIYLNIINKDQTSTTYNSSIRLQKFKIQIVEII